jgi:uncharacterized protein YjbI with pentapeptide repeats
MERIGWDQSVQKLIDEGILWGDEARPVLPSRRPGFGDDEPLGVSFFRTRLNDAQLMNLTLPRTFFGRSGINNSSFENTDLSESTLCWNDFIDVSFRNADLHYSDLRASIFERVDFTEANLGSCDLRLSSFIACVFRGAILDNAKLTPDQVAKLTLSPEQMNRIYLQDDAGDPPPGG